MEVALLEGLFCLHTGESTAEELRISRSAQSCHLKLHVFCWAQKTSMPSVVDREAKASRVMGLQ